MENPQAKRPVSQEIPAQKKRKRGVEGHGEPTKGVIVLDEEEEVQCKAGEAVHDNSSSALLAVCSAS